VFRAISLIFDFEKEQRLVISDVSEFLNRLEIL
jgi:hypothetical protein